MKMYNEATGKVENLPKTIPVNGVNMFTSKMNIEQLNAARWFNVVTSSQPDRRYYSFTRYSEMVGNVWTTSFIPTELEVDIVAARMIKSIEDTANSKFNEATQGYTAGEMSSWNELESDARSHQETPLTEGMLYDEALISGITIDELATKVLANANAFKQVKAYISGTRKRKITEVGLLTTVDECIFYERSPYEYILTEDDVIDGEGTVGDVVTRYTNNCKDW